jgi:hypothetical protein
MKQKNIELHNKCQCELRSRHFKGKDTPTPGLFCSDHDVFLDWLSRDIADELIQHGVPVTPYHERPKRKKNRATRTHYQQWQKNNRKKAKKTQPLTAALKTAIINRH